MWLTTSFQGVFLPKEQEVYADEPAADRRETEDPARVAHAHRPTEAFSESSRKTRSGLVFL